jgi:hypothetical protein
MNPLYSTFRSSAESEERQNGESGGPSFNVFQKYGSSHAPGSLVCVRSDGPRRAGSDGRNSYHVTLRRSREVARTMYWYTEMHAVVKISRLSKIAGVGFIGFCAASMAADKANLGQTLSQAAGFAGALLVLLCHK